MVPPIYLYDKGNLQKFVSTFDTIDGSAVVDLDLGGKISIPSEAINEAGDIVLKFKPADGRIGVAVWRRLGNKPSGVNCSRPDT